MNGKSLEFSGRVCEPGSCIYPRLKWMFIGDKILSPIYDSTTQTYSNEGPRYIIGKTIDTKHDEYGWRQGTRSDPNPVHANDENFATAERLGDDFIVRDTMHTFTNGANELYDFESKKVVHIVNCNTCDLMLWEDHHTFRGRSFISRPREYWCRMVD